MDVTGLQDSRSPPGNWQLYSDAAGMIDNHGICNLLPKLRSEAIGGWEVLRVKLLTLQHDVISWIRHWTCAPKHQTMPRISWYPSQQHIPILTGNIMCGLHFRTSPIALSEIKRPEILMNSISLEKTSQGSEGHCIPRVPISIIVIIPEKDHFLLGNVTGIKLQSNHIELCHLNSWTLESS